MKICQLELTAFGPFSGESLDFGDGSQGLHLVFGPNEAGKTSALRAIRSLLYGIPARTPDSFIHPYKNLRIGAVLAHSEGKVLQLVRRKAIRNTLRGPCDRVIVEDGELERFLGGVDEDLFCSLFGIDHARLQKGGEEILRGGGRLGELLFSTGAGVADLRATQERLEAEMDALFKSTGRNPQINQAIAALKDARQALKEAQLSVDEWRRHDEDLRDAQEQKRTLDQQLREKQSQAARLTRIRDALPAIGQWKSTRRELEQYPDAPGLPEDFPQRRSDAEIRLRKAEQQRDDATKAIDDLRREQQSLHVPHELLAEAEATEQLHTRLGGHRKAMSDRPNLLTRCQMAERDAEEILRQLGKPPDLKEVESLRLPEDRIVRIQNLANQREGLNQRLEATRLECQRRDRAIARAESELADLGAVTDPDRLSLAVRRFQSRCDAESELQALTKEIETAAAECDVLLERLPLWTGTLQDVERLAVPAVETIEHFEEVLRDKHAAVDSCRGQKESLARSLQDLQTELDSLQREHAVPSEADVLEARRLRDSGWQLVLADWRTGGGPEADAGQFIAQFPPATDLAEAYRGSVKQADGLADRLRREADRAARKASLQAGREQHRQEIDAADRALAAAERELSRARGSWAEQWVPLGITPLSPREMRAWHRNQQQLTSLAANLRAKEAEKDRLERQIATDRTELAELLAQYDESPGGGEGVTLGDLLQRAQGHLDCLQERRSREHQLRRQLAADAAELEEATSAHERAAEAWKEWQADWNQEMKRLRLEEDTTPAQANTVLTALNQLFLKTHDADQLRLRIEGIDEDARQFETEVAYVVDRVAPEWAGQRADKIVEQLTANLDAAKLTRQRHESLTQRRAEETASLQQAHAAISAVEAELAAMCQQAGCETPADLAAAEKRSARRRELESRLRDLEEQLGPLSGGKELIAFVAEVDAEVTDPDELQVRIAELQEEIDRLSGRREELVHVIAREENELARMDGSAVASERAAECENLVASLEEPLHELAVLRVASAVLRNGIERFRERNQGPLLERAGQLFAELTEGSFETLRADFDDRGEPVLMGVRSGGESLVGVDGMSDGTCDQLYLALRIASLETWLKHHEPLPFIVDDVLLNFDDDRAVAALRVLGALSCSTQVIFFTHHRHLVELSQQHLPPECLFVHQLRNGLL